MNLVQHGFAHHARAAKIASPLLRHPRSQVASAALAVLRLPGSRQPETLFGSFVSLHLGHGSNLSRRNLICGKPFILGKSTNCGKGDREFFVATPFI